MVPISGMVIWNLGQHFEEECLEGFVGTVQFVDEEDGRSFGRGAQRLEEGTADEEAFAEHVLRHALSRRVASGLGEPDLQHLPLVVPLVDGRRHVEPLVALEADEGTAETGGQNLGDLGLADPRLPPPGTGAGPA